jgi:hypothetical protein
LKLLTSWPHQMTLRLVAIIPTNLSRIAIK